MLLSRLPKPVQKLLPGLLILLTAVIFIHFVQTHHELGHALRATNPRLLGLIVVLYGAVLLSLCYVYQITIRICGHTLNWRENALLTAYSTIANFFGPLQSGPGVRAVYLKQKHNVRLRDYGVASLIYYGFFASISAAFLLIGAVSWWLSIPGTLAAVGFSYLVIRISLGRNKRSGEAQLRLTPRLLTQLFVATLIQLTLTAIIYGIELQAVHAHTSIRQAIIFTGAGNFALFVSLTPGAIGFRESFQIFARRLHHISNTLILAASIIDRAAYLIFLLVLLVFVLLSHAQDHLQLKSSATVKKG